MSDRKLESDYEQYEREVDSIPLINGAKCFVWIDVTTLGSDLAWQMTQATGTGPSDQELADSIADAIAAKIAEKCPDGPVKVEIHYHAGSKPIYRDKKGMRPWQQQVSIELALRKLAGQAAGGRIQKLYLKGCFSDTDLNLVNAGFGLPGLEFVVTVDDIVFHLPPGVFCGGDEGYKPQPLGVTIWKKEDDKQIAQKGGRFDDDERYNVHTGLVEDQADPVTGPCPSLLRLSGKEKQWIMSGSLKNVEAYIDLLRSSSNHVEMLARGSAGHKSHIQSRKHDCPNPHCQKKRIAPPVVSNIHFTRIASFWGFLPFVPAYTGYLNFNWTADMWCE